MMCTLISFVSIGLVVMINLSIENPIGVGKNLMSRIIIFVYYSEEINYALFVLFTLLVSR